MRSDRGEKPADLLVMRWLIVIALVATGCTRASAPRARLAGEIASLTGVGGIVASASLTGVSGDFKKAVIGFSVLTLVGMVTYAVGELTDPSADDPALEHQRWARELTRQAARDARAGKCADVRQLEPRVRGYDAEVHDLVFMRDPEIARCLAE
ncbi:MAG TPA: hypothetical protein VFP84_20890 [Kofleriaceae bacterium]|nr:hypothetical protein [Kofleriaceae bacterium]